MMQQYPKLLYCFVIYGQHYHVRLNINNAWVSNYLKNTVLTYEKAM